MGEIIKAYCPCGLEIHGLRTGFGRNDMRANLAPAVCLTCNSWSVFDYNEIPIDGSVKCECGSPYSFFNKTGMTSRTPEEEKAILQARQEDILSQGVWSRLFDWFFEFIEVKIDKQRKTDFPLTPSKEALCPKCRKFTLEFKNEGMWD